MGIDIKIHIDLTPRQKKIVRAAVTAGAAIGALGIGIAIAAPIDTTWVATGQPLTATQLKGDLDGLQSQITTLQTSVTALQAFQTQATASGAYAVGAKYCGISPSSTTGAISYGGFTGYAAARAMCQASTGCGMSATAHMCTGDEVVRSAALGIMTPQVSTYGWYAGSYRSNDGTSVVVVDCAGYTSAVETTGPLPPSDRLTARHLGLAIHPCRFSVVTETKPPPYWRTS